MNDEPIVVAMETFGGSFVQALAAAFRRADMVNQQRLRLAFPDVWDKYRELAQVAARQQ